MIDPKLDKLPVEANDEIVAASERAGATASGTKGPRRGLSINDTVAANSNMSVGGRGVDTSGVRAGAGAGAGTTMVTPGEAGESPAPQFVGGDRGTGTTVLGINDSSTVGSTVPAATDETDLVGADDEIATLAYQCWCDRGNPVGSPEVDWHEAVTRYRESRNSLSHTAKA